MRRRILLVGVLAALGVVAILLAVSNRPERPEPGATARTSRSPESETLRDSVAARGDDLPAGVGAIFGTVRRGRDPVPAAIEVRRLRETGETSSPPWREYDLSLLDAPEPGVVAARAAADEDGTFVVPGIGPGVWEVVARAADGATGHAVVSRIARRERSGVELVLPDSTARLQGHAAHSDGRPWTGAIVFLAAARRPASWGWWTTAEFDLLSGTAGRARSDERGRFVVVGIGPGEVYPAVRLGPDTLMVLAPVEAPWRGDLRLVVDPALTFVSGRVLDDRTGEPVAGATVLVDEGDDDDRFHRLVARRRTAGDGAFRIPAPADATLRVSAPGRALVEKERDGEASEIEIRLRPEARLRGRVVLAPEDRPAAGVPVEILVPWMQDEPLVLTRTDADGCFEVGGLPGTVVIARASVPGRVVAGMGQVTDRCNPCGALLRSGETAVVDVRLVPGLRVLGRVVDSSGRGVSGARVAATGASIRTWETVTGERGEFGFDLHDTIVDGAYDFEARASGRASVVVSRLVIPGENEFVEIRLPDPRRLELLVVDGGTGEPVEGAFVAADFAAGWLYGNWPPRLESGRNGRVSLGPLPPGRVEIEVTHSDDSGPPIPIRLEPGERGIVRRTVALMRLAPEAQHVPGGSSGNSPSPPPPKPPRPPPDITITVTGSEGRPPSSCWASADPHAETRTSVGRVEIWTEKRSTVLISGGHDADGRHPGWAVIGPIDPGGAETAVTLRPGGSIRGVVLAPGGEPLRGCRVWAHPRVGGRTWRSVADAWTGPDGRFELESLGPWPHVLEVTGPATLRMPEGLEATPGGPEIVVRLRRAANVVLTVVDEDGDPVPGATCDIDDLMLWSDDRGRILLAGLDPEVRYDLRVSAESPETGVRVIENWSPASTTVRLPRRWFIRGVVVDPAGKPIPATRVTWAVPGEDSTTDFRADEFGEFLIEDLDPGTILVWASTPRGLRKSERLTVAAGRADVELVLDPGVELRVDVRGWRSNLGNYTWALIRESGGKWRMTRRFGDEILFEELEESRRYDVLAGPTEDGRWVMGTGLVPGRRALALVPGVPLRGRIVAPEGANGLWLSVRFDGFDYGLDLDEERRFDWSCPPRDFTLHATAEVEGRILTAEIPASECVDREVVLEPK